MRKRKLSKGFLAGMLAAALLTAPVQAASPEIRIGSYKGNELSVGERSGLIIGPNKDAALSVASSDLEVVSVENVLGFWVAVTHAEGTATVTATGRDGETASVTLTVGSGTSAIGEVLDTPSDSKAGTEELPVGGPDLSANMDIRLEMVRFINETRLKNGLAELPTEESLMNAAQDVSAQQVREHRPYDHYALIRYGWPHAGMYNLTVFSPNAHPDIARKAVEDWANSPGHLETMLMEEASCLGTGVTINGPWVYCYMVVGDPTAHNPFE